MYDVIPAWVDGQLAPVDKMGVHRRGLRHLAVSVFVLQGDRVLIQQRAAGKYHTPLLWANSCCTHPLWGETDHDCAIRRLDEELGINGLALQSIGTVEYRAHVGNGLTEHEVVRIFVGHATERLILCPNPDEVAATRWVAVPALAEEVARSPDQFTPWLRIYLAEHRDMIFAPESLAELRG